jgi:hypothetical protein
MFVMKLCLVLSVLTVPHPFVNQAYDFSASSAPASSRPVRSLMPTPPLRLHESEYGHLPVVVLSCLTQIATFCLKEVVDNDLKISRSRGFHHLFPKLVNISTVTSSESLMRPSSSTEALV